MRTFIDIRDFADSLIFVLENFDNLKYRVYNVGHEKNNWTKRQLAEYIKERTGCHVAYAETYKDEDARDYACDYRRIREAGFNVKYFSNGDRYEGCLVNGRKHGPGKLTYTDGGTLEGEWRDNKFYSRVEPAEYKNFLNKELESQGLDSPEVVLGHFAADFYKG